MLEDMSARTRVGPGSAEARPTAIKIASIAIAWIKQERHLRVRQREELRRAFATAAEFRGWIASGPNPTDPAIKDVISLTKAGAKHMAQDLVERVALKKKESQTLQKTADSIAKMAEKGDWDEPVEVDYSFTGREEDHLATKTETFTLANADEARDAVALMEKKSGSWETLRVQMLEDLKGKQKQVKGLEAEIKDFAEFARGLVDDVLAILH